jgi:carbamoyl-phosphate synthase small subunit
MQPAFILLENGEVFEGRFTRQVNHTIEGEIVFNTSMTGYQEIITDPSYADQIVTLTYPLIGTYGSSRKWNESTKIFAKCLVVKEYQKNPNHFQNEEDFDAFLAKHSISIIEGIDTRDLTKIIRNYGVMKAVIGSNLESLRVQMKEAKNRMPKIGNEIEHVSTKKSYHIGKGKYHVVVIDFGVKSSMLDDLLKRDIALTVVPYNTSYDEIKSLNPDGIMLSNGPGDPQAMEGVLPTIYKLQSVYPMLCICMGHQVFALANGAKTYKLKFGHRGANHPIKDLASGKVYMSSQNHGYAVDVNSIKNTELEISQINLNDNTIEGLKHKKYPVISVQYHPEAHPGPTDSQYIFDQFKSFMEKK